ncbi:MAG: AAA family ATPase [Dehalococcoidia bacterium]|nr:AAA family ATPase [Dehalococcoidia bacterium]
MLVLTAGLPGTGKSGVARFVGKELHAPVLDKDVIKSALLERGEQDWNRSGSLAYTILRDLTHELLRQGFDVVIDSPGHYKRFQADMVAVAEEHGSEIRLIECICSDDEERQRRFARRKSGGAMPAQMDDLDEVLDEVEREDFTPEGLPALQVDTCVDEDEMQRKIKKYLAERPNLAEIAGDVRRSTVKEEEGDG